MATRVIEIEFEEGEIVYLRTDVDQAPRLVVGFRVLNQCMLYEVMSGTIQSVHYGIELSREKQLVNAL